MAFEKAHQGELGSSTRAVKQAIEASQANVEWMTNNFQVILSSFSPSLYLSVAQALSVSLWWSSYHMIMADVEFITNNFKVILSPSSVYLSL